MARLKKNAEGQRSESKKKSLNCSQNFQEKKRVTRSKVLAETKTQEQIDEEIRNKYIKIAESDGRKLTEAQLKRLVEQNKKLEVNIDFDSWLGSNFFSTEVVGKTAL